MKAPLNLAFFGSSLVSAYWNGPATYYRGLLRALAQRGHRVTFYEPHAPDRQSHRDLPDPPWARVVSYPAQNPDDTLAAAAAARGADLVVKASGVGAHDALLEAAVLDLRGPATLVAFWDVEAPATLDRVAADPTDPLPALVPQYDLVFTSGGGAPVIKAYDRLGARRCVPIHPAIDPATHFRVAAEARFEGDLAFLGNRLPDRERRAEEFFLAVARRRQDARFVLGGSGWEDKPRPVNLRYVGHVFTRDHNAFNSSPLAVLNVTRESMARYGFSPAPRVFEAAGAGACLVTDAWEGVELFLEPESEVLVARSGAEVAAHLAALTPQRAREIGRAARRWVLARHTYAQRAAAVEAALSGREAAAPDGSRRRG